MIYSQQVVMKNKGPKFISIVTIQRSSCAINSYSNGINQNGTNDHNPYSLWYSLEIKIRDPIFLGIVRSRAEETAGELITCVTDRMLQEGKEESGKGWETGTAK